VKNPKDRLSAGAVCDILSSLLGFTSITPPTPVSSPLQPNTLVRSTRCKTSQAPSKPIGRSTKVSKPKRRQQRGKAADDEDHMDLVESSSDDSGDVYEELASAGEDEDDVEPMDSDALDDKAIDKSRKRKCASPASSRTKSPRKKKKDNNDESEDNFDLKDGQLEEVVGTIVPAPKTGRGTCPP
jgi:hypothetical protein